MSFKTWVQILMGVTGFVIWSYASYMELQLPDDYLAFVKGIVIGVAALALRDMVPSDQDKRSVAAATDKLNEGEKQQ